MTTLLVVGGVIAVLALVAGRKTIGRVFAAAQGQTNKAGRAVWGYDPVAVFQKQVDDATEEIKQGKSGLEQYRGLTSQLQRRVEADKNEVAVWDARARGFLTQGNEAKAADALGKRNAAQKSLDSNSAQLKTYETAYNNNLKKMQFAQTRIEEAKREAAKLSADLKMSQAEAEIANLAASFNTKTTALDGLGETREEIQRQIDANRAKAQVATDLGGDDLSNYEAEDAAKTAAAAADLENLKAEMGLGCKTSPTCQGPNCH